MGLIAPISAIYSWEGYKYQGNIAGFLVLRRRNIQIVLSIGLQLSFEEAESLMKSAGYAFSHSRKADVIVEYFF